MSKLSPQPAYPDGGSLQSQRIISSSILSEFPAGPVPEDTVKYVEVPVVEEVIKHVSRREIVEVEKRVPKYEFQWMERIVEVPQIQYMDKHVEVPRVQEVVKTVPIRQVVDVQKEVIKYIPKVEVKYVEQTVEVPGEVVEVPKPYLVENKVVIPRFVDHEVATVVAQRLQPIIVEAEDEFIDVELKQYEPVLVPVDVYLPRPIERQLIATQRFDESNCVKVPPAQFNALIKALNQTLTDKDLESAMQKAPDGSIPLLSGPGASLVSPLDEMWQGSQGDIANWCTMDFSNVQDALLSSTQMLSQSNVPMFQGGGLGTSHFGQAGAQSYYSTTGAMPMSQYQHTSGYPAGTTGLTSSINSSHLPGSSYQTSTGGYQTGGYQTGGYQTGGYQTSGYQTSGYPTSTGGYQTSTGGYPTSTGGYQTSTGGYQTSTGGYQTSAVGGYLPSSMQHSSYIPTTAYQHPAAGMSFGDPGLLMQQ